MTKYFLLLCAANICAWFINCSVILWDKAEQHKLGIAVVGGAIVTYLYMSATQVGYENTNKLWTLKVIGFAVSTTVFTVLTWLILHEIPNWRHAISLVLAICIILLHIL
jgi:drug/metabolite transporter (DMT)-like permease